MAIKLNKYAVRCEEIAIASDKITPNSSAQPLLYELSRNWRKLIDSTNESKGSWSEKEEVAGEVIITAVTYLQRIGCANIEKLLIDTIERLARQIE